MRRKRSTRRSSYGYGNAYGRPRQRSKSRWLLVLIVLLLLAAVGALAAIPPLVIGDMVNQKVVFASVYQGSDFGLDVQDLRLPTSDGLVLSAFEVEVENPHGVVIFISGIHNPSVTAFLGHARLLQEHGYASILYDMRAHGSSDGDVIGLGYTEVQDTQAVVDYIQNQSRYAHSPIIVYGLSMGGAVAINSIGQIPAIDGLISMSAYSSWPDVFVEGMTASGAPAFLAPVQKPFVRLYTILKYGWSTRNTYPIRQLQNLGPRPALLVHSTADSQVSFANFERLQAAAPDHVQTWIRQGDMHMISTDFLEPENDPEYIEQILGFLEEHFGLAEPQIEEPTDLPDEDEPVAP